MYLMHKQSPYVRHLIVTVVKYANGYFISRGLHYSCFGMD